MANFDTLLQAIQLVEKDEDSTKQLSPTSKKRSREEINGETNNSSPAASDSEFKRGRTGNFGAASREAHNKLEKNRRAELKVFFQKLKDSIPSLKGQKKASNVSILKGAKLYIQELNNISKQQESEVWRLQQCRMCLEKKQKQLKDDVFRHHLQTQLFAQVRQEKQLTVCRTNSVETQADEDCILLETQDNIDKPLETPELFLQTDNFVSLSAMCNFSNCAENSLEEDVPPDRTKNSEQCSESDDELILEV